MNTNNTTNKYSKPLGILLCAGVFAGLIYLSYSNRQKAEEFSKANGQNNILEISRSTKSASLDHSQHIIRDISLEKDLRIAVAESISHDFHLDEENDFHHHTWDMMERGDTPHKRDLKLARKIALFRELGVFPDPATSEKGAEIFCRYWETKNCSMNLLQNNKLKIEFTEYEKQLIQKLKNFFNDEKKMFVVLGIKELRGKVFLGGGNLPNEYYKYQEAVKILKHIGTNRLHIIQDSASIESKSSEEAKVATLNNFRNHVAPVFKWNLDKEWEWKPFDAGDEVELKEIKNIEKDEMNDIRDVNARLRELIVAKEIFITVETHLLPDPRSSEEALDDFINFWRHQEPISDLIRMRLKYMASFNSEFSEQEMQTIAEARKFFSDQEKMKAIRQKIKEAKNLDDLFNDGNNKALVGPFLEHLVKINKIVYYNH